MHSVEQEYDIQAEDHEILIVEDSPTQAERLRRLIQSEGYRVRVASNGQRALNLIRERKPQLVVSDIIMPEMNGYDLCRALKADPTLRDIPVILVTALNDAKDIIRGIECGADNFIRKPYSEEYLLNRISQVLLNQRLRQDAGAESRHRHLPGRAEARHQRQPPADARPADLDLRTGGAGQWRIAGTRTPGARTEHEAVDTMRPNWKRITRKSRARISSWPRRAA